MYVLLDCFRHEAAYRLTRAPTITDLGCRKLAEISGKIEIEYPLGWHSGLALNEQSDAVEPGAAAAGYDEAAPSKKILECFNPVAEFPVIPRRVSVSRIKHALECIEADDEVQIGLRRVGVIESINHVNVEGVR